MEAASLEQRWIANPAEERRSAERRPKMQLAYDIDFATHSTNLVARRRSTPLGAASLPWPSLGC